MGDPKIIRKKFESPSHPWQKSRIEEERQLIREYGLKNKSEIWKMKSKAKNFADQAKRLTAQETSQSKKEEQQILKKLYRFGFLAQGATVDDALGINTKNMLERRLQTIVFKKGLARSAKQARQFITHRHILVGGKVVTAPAYIVPVAEEETVSFRTKSALFDPEHPERAVEEKPKPAPKMPAKKAEKEAKKKKETNPGKKEKSPKPEQKEEKHSEKKVEESKGEKKEAKETPAKKEKEEPNKGEKAGENKK